MHPNMKMHSFPSFLVTFIFLWGGEKKEENAVVDGGYNIEMESERTSESVLRLLLIPSSSS